MPSGKPDDPINMKGDVDVRDSPQLGAIKTVLSGGAAAPLSVRLGDGTGFYTRFPITTATPNAGQIIDETGTTRTVNSTFANPAVIGSNAIVAAQGGVIKIRVHAVVLTATAGVTANFLSAAAAISANYPLVAGTPLVLPWCDHGWIKTNGNEALNLNLSLGIGIGCNILWTQAL